MALQACEDERKEQRKYTVIKNGVNWYQVTSVRFFCVKEREYIIGIQRMPGRPHVSSLTAI
jgi:hypothetical protein